VYVGVRDDVEVAVRVAVDVSVEVTVSDGTGVRVGEDVTVSVGNAVWLGEMVCVDVAVGDASAGARVGRAVSEAASVLVEDGRCETCVRPIVGVT
jgi:hypothetical protein